MRSNNIRKLGSVPQAAKCESNFDFRPNGFQDKDIQFIFPLFRNQTYDRYIKKQWQTFVLKNVNDLGRDNAKYEYQKNLNQKTYEFQNNSVKSLQQHYFKDLSIFSKSKAFLIYPKYKKSFQNFTNLDENQAQAEAILEKINFTPKFSKHFVNPSNSWLYFCEGDSIHLEAKIDFLNMDGQLLDYYKEQHLTKENKYYFMEWSHNGNIINKEDIKHFQVLNYMGIVVVDFKNVNPQINGTFKCRIWNELGEDESIFIINCSTPKSVFSDKKNGKNSRTKNERHRSFISSSSVSIEEEPTQKPSCLDDKIPYNHFPKKETSKQLSMNLEKVREVDIVQNADRSFSGQRRKKRMNSYASNNAANFNRSSSHYERHYEDSADNLRTGPGYETSSFSTSDLHSTGRVKKRGGVYGEEYSYSRSREVEPLRDQTNIIVPINSDKYESSYKYDKPEDGYKMAYYNRSSGGNNKNSLFASKYERSGDNREMEEHYLEEQIILRPGGAVQKIIVPALHETTKAITETKQEHYISGGTKYPKPYFKVHLKDQNNLVEGQPVHLECRVEPKSDPHLKIDWYFDNSPLKTDKRVHTVYDYGYASLSITESSAPADSGIYVARASNQAGEAYSTASLCLAPLKSIITETQTTTQFDELEMEKFIYDADRDRPVLGEDKEVQAYLRTSVIRPKFSKPTFTSRFEDTLYYRDGDRIKLEANLVPLGDKSLKIEWLKNGEPLVLNARTQTFHENGRVGLEIYPAEVFDEGIYTCQATSDNGYAAISTRLKYIPERAPIYHYQDGKKFVEEEEEGVAPMLTPGDMSIKKPRVPKKRPCFKSDLKGIDLEEGQGIHLEAKLEPLDDSNLKVDWFKDGQPLKESPKIKAGQDKGKVYLDMDDMKPKDSGVYKCKASNDFGEAIISAPITVHPPEPDQVSDYWWRDKYPPLKKPAPLSPAPFSPIIINKKKRQPPPPPPQEEEDLEFIKGQSRENRRFDTEVDLPPRFITDISDLQANEWDKIRFEARLEPANDKTTQIFWYHDGKILNASSRIKTLFDYGVVILEITDITTKDAGLYECIATNNFGSDSTRAILTVREDDERIIQDTGLSSQRSSVARVKDIEETVERTIIELYPPPETLLKSFKEDDYTSGQRIYKVENEYVTDGSTFYDKRPIFLTELNDVRVKKHDTIRLEAKVVPSIKEDNSLQVGWYKNGKLILIEESSERIQIFNDANSGFAVLEIRDAQTSDSGEYVCVVRNSNGQALSKCKVVCKDDHFGEPPFFVNRYMRLDNLNEGDTAHVEFRLEPAEDQNMKVEWFFNGQPLQRGYRTKTLHDFGYTILDISPIYAENSGVYECKATNHYGTKTAVAVVDCKGKRDAKWDTHIPSQTSDQDQTTRRRTEQEQHWISKADLTLNQPKIRLQRKPVFTTPLHKFTNLKEGDSCHFVTTIEPADDDRLQIQWFLDGKLISQENRIKMVHNFGYVVLDISPVKVCDTGIYTCVAKNDFGEDTVSGTLHCKAFEQIAPPKFRVPLKNLEVYEGETAHFKAILEPNFDPNLKVEWFFEDKPILGSTRFRPHSDGNLATLDITPAYSEDSGTYKLVAVNAEGRQSAASAATLKCYPRPVPPRPSFLAPLTLASPMKKGWPALIETRVIPGLGSDLEIEWSINGTPLQALNRDKYRFVRDAASGYVGLHICASQISNSGRYTVLARNETGSDSISANFEVEKEEDEKREEAIYVSRFKTHIYPAKEKEISTIEKKEIETKEVITSTTTIVSEAPKFSKKLEPINTVVGKSAIFSVLFNGNPPPQVIWKRENYEIHNSPDFIITTTNTSSTLIIKKVCIEDTGTISCNILNTAGWAESSAKLNVEKPHIEIKREDLERTETVAIIETIPTAPRIIQPLRDCITTQGQSAFFQCTIYGYPAPQIEWFKNDQPLQTTSSGPQSPPYISVTATESKEVSGNYIFTLKLAECYLEDEGVYSCRLTNPSGSITTSATLKVQQFRPDTEGPSFIRSLESTRVIEGTPITFSCILTGKPKPAILWFKDGSEIKPSSKYQITYTGTNCKLTVQNCQESDNGTYMCKAQNASGTAECSAALLVERKKDKGVVLVRTDVDTLITTSLTTFKNDITQ
ncbi:unnamed protein product [Gordionus sp. m RMFG-2023]